MNIDLAISLSIFFIFLAILVTYIVNTYSQIPNLRTIASFREESLKLMRSLLSEGTPSNWASKKIVPTSLGIETKTYRVPIIIKEESGHERTNSPVHVHVVADPSCQKICWNTTLRLYDSDLNEIPFKAFNEVYCSSGYLKEFDLFFLVNISSNSSKVFYLFFSNNTKIKAKNYTFDLKAWWSFDEALGTKIYDISGNGNDGNLVNSPQWVDGKFGKALSFDGEDDYVSVPDSNSLDLTDAFTIAAWIKYNGPMSGTYYKVITWKDSKHDWYDAPYALYYDWYDGHKIMTVIYNGTNYDWLRSSTSGLNDSKWHFVVFTYDGTRMKIYLDGNLDASKTTSIGSLNVSTTLLQMGGSPTNNRWFNGTIDEVRIYNRALNEAEIHAIYQNNSFIRKGLVGYWRFDEGSGSTVHDTHHIIYPTNSKEDIKFGKALSFDGEDDYVEVNIGNSILTDFTDAFSVEAWVKPSAITTEHGLIYFDENLYLFRMTYYTNNRAYAYVRRTDDTWMSCSCLPDGGIQAGKWYHYVVVFDGQTHLYVNGKLCCESSSTGTMKTPTGSKIWIGRSGFLNGTIDEVRIYNRALTADEIVTLNNSAPLSAKVLPTSSISVISSEKLNVLRNITYNKLKQALGTNYEFRIEIEPG